MFSLIKRSSCVITAMLCCTLLSGAIVSSVSAASAQETQADSELMKRLNDTATSLYRKSSRTI